MYVMLIACVPELTSRVEETRFALRGGYKARGEGGRTDPDAHVWTMSRALLQQSEAEAEGS